MLINNDMLKQIKPKDSCKKMWMYNVLVSQKKCHDEFLTININTYRVTPAPPICTRWDLMELRIFLIFVLTLSLSVSCPDDIT